MSSMRLASDAAGEIAGAGNAEEEWSIEEYD